MCKGPLKSDAETIRTSSVHIIRGTIIRGTAAAVCPSKPPQPMRYWNRQQGRNGFKCAVPIQPRGEGRMAEPLVQGFSVVALKAWGPRAAIKLMIVLWFQGGASGRWEDGEIGVLQDPAGRPFPERARGSCRNVGLFALAQDRCRRSRENFRHAPR